jgi:hypothetical protein
MMGRSLCKFLFMKHRIREAEKEYYPKVNPTVIGSVSGGRDKGK